MLYPVFGIDFGIFPIYYLMLTVALISGFIAYKKAFPKKQYSPFVYKKIRKSLFRGGVSGLICSNVITWLVHDEVASLSLFGRIFSGGYSLYYGLIGFFFFTALSMYYEKLDVTYCINKILRAVSLAHFFARLGCSLRGCCYGAEIELFGAAFHLPVREAEALLALIFAILPEKLMFAKRASLYLFTYSAFRFVTDFMRGDEPGVLFGITAVSPVQIASYIVLTFTGIHLFLRPVFRLFGKEQLIDEAKNSILTQYLDVKGKIFKKSENIAVYPAGYMPRIRKSGIGKKLISLTLSAAVVSSAVIYVNPLDTEFGNTIADFIDDNVLSLFAPKNPARETGTVNGTALHSPEEKKLATAASEALSFLKSTDNEQSFSYVCTKEEALSSGNTYFVFTQTMNGKTLFGKNRVVVKDKNDEILYVAGDTAQLTYTAEKNTSYNAPMGTIEESFGEDVTVLGKTEGLYDTGSGVIDAYYAVLSDDGKTPVLGVIADSDSDRIISITDTKGNPVKNNSHSSVVRGAEEFSRILRENDTDALNEISTQKLSKVNDIEKNSFRIKKSLYKVLEKTDIDKKDFTEALDNAAEISSEITNLNSVLFRDIFLYEITDTAYNKASEKDIEELTSAVHQAFSDNGIKNTPDEAAMAVEVKNTRSSYGCGINFAGDSDSFTVTGEINTTTSIEIDSTVPVEIEVYSEDGSSVVSMYVTEKEEINLYPEDGSSFVIKVKDAREIVFDDSEDGKYDISFKATEEKVPQGIRNVLDTVEAAYNTSLLPVLYTVYAPGGQYGNIYEILTTGILTYASDSCYTKCLGAGDTVDSAKSVIMSEIAEQYHHSFDALKDTRLELSHVQHIEKKNYTALKAQIKITMGEMVIYKGYTLMRLEPMDFVKFGADEGLIKVIELFTSVAGDFYTVTEINSTALYDTFGDVPGAISPESDLDSLYDLWEPSVKTINSYSFTLMSIDEEKASAAGHSQEKIQSFRKYTARYNLSQARMLENSVQTAYNTAMLIYTVGRPVKDIFDLVTNPVGFLVDKVAEKSEVTDAIWTMAKFLTDPQGVVTDEVFGVIFDCAENYAEELLLELAVISPVVTELERIYREI